MDDTIVAIATPFGEGGLGVVRLSGPKAFEIADAIFSGSKILTQVQSHTLHHGWIQKVDEVLAGVFRKPASYTGEDVVEFSCHGSPAVLKKIVDLCLKNGARLAKPGEFTERAYLNGKMDLAQAEAVTELIHAQSSRAHEAALNQLQGKLSLIIKDIRDRIVDVLARIEANLDFEEEGIPYINRVDVSKILGETKSHINELISTSLKGRFLRSGIRVVFAGKPNVGKSSLFNALLAQDRAIVTDIPGTTRDILEERVEWDGYPIVLIDTAGLRETSDQVELEGARRAQKAHEDSDVLLLVLDGSQPITEEDRSVSTRLGGKNVVVALNKADITTTGRWNDEKDSIRVSAKTGLGLSDLKQKILNRIKNQFPENESALVVTNMRHVHHLERTVTYLNSAEEALKNNQTEEAIAMELRLALKELGMITGEAVTEDVLSAIFRTFCIGK